MKKIVSILLSVSMLLSLAIGFETTSHAASVKKYKKVAKSALSSHKKYQNYGSYYQYFEGNAFLYDFDKNGTKELVMLYGGLKNNCPAYYLSVYTIKNGKAKALIKKKCIQQDAGAPRQCVGVAKKKGKSYLLFGKGNSSGNGKYFNLTYYRIKGSKIYKKYSGKGSYRFRYLKNNKTKAYSITKINGKKVKNKKFNKWQKSFKMKYVTAGKVTFMNKIKHYEYYPSTACSSIKSIYKKVS